MFNEKYQSEKKIFFSNQTWCCKHEIIFLFRFFSFSQKTTPLWKLSLTKSFPKASHPCKVLVWNKNYQYFLCFLQEKLYIVPKLKFVYLANVSKMHESTFVSVSLDLVLDYDCEEDLLRYPLVYKHLHSTSEDGEEPCKCNIFHVTEMQWFLECCWICGI